jgi:hypothetical protein
LKAREFYLGQQLCACQLRGTPVKSYKASLPKADSTLLFVVHKQADQHVRAALIDRFRTAAALQQYSMAFIMTLIH